MITCPQCGAACKPTDKFCNSCGMLIASAAPPPAPGGFGAAPGAPAFVAPPPAPGGFGAAPAFGAPPPAPGGFGAAPAAPAFGAPPPAPGGFGAAPAFGAPPPAPGGFGSPAPAPGGYAPPAANYGASPPYVAPPQPDAYGAPQPQFGAPQPQFGAPQPQFGAPFQAPAQAPPAQAAFNAPAPFAPVAEAPLPPAFAVEAPAAAVAPATEAEALRGFLVAYQSNPNGDFWPLHGGTHAVGRAGASDGLAIPLADATISSKHAQLEVDAAAGTICVQDSGSTNGTYVNDEHLGMNGRRELHDGDRVRFGGFTTVVKIIGRV